MANNQISIDRTKPRGQLLSNARDMLLRALNALSEERGKMVQIGTDVDAPLEAQYGLVSGKGVACFSQLDSMMGAIGFPTTNPSGTISRAAVWAAIMQFIDQVG